MELAKRRIKVFSKASPVKLYPIGDTHLCAPACDVAHLKRTVEQIRSDPDALWIGLGDYSDCILPGDPRWTLRAINLQDLPRDTKGRPDVTDLASWQVDAVDAIFEPIWDKCLGLLEGNHEQAMYRHYHTDLTRQLVRRRGVPYLGQTCLYRLEFEANKEIARVDVFAEHGATGGGSDGNAVNNFAKRLAGWDADLYLKGHVHKRRVAFEGEALGWGGRKPRVRQRLGLLTGTYLKTYTDELTYGERAAYEPVKIGSMVVVMRPFQGEMQAVNAEALGILRAA